MKDQNGAPISKTSFREDVKTNDEGQVTLKLRDNEEFTFADLNIGTQFSIVELNTPNDYDVTYQIGENQPTDDSINDVSLTSDTIVIVMNKMNDKSIIPGTNIPTSGLNNTITMLAIGSLGIIGIVTLLWYWRKKHV